MLHVCDRSHNLRQLQARQINAGPTMFGDVANDGHGWVVRILRKNGASKPVEQEQQRTGVTLHACDPPEKGKNISTLAPIFPWNKRGSHMKAIDAASSIGCANAQRVIRQVMTSKVRWISWIRLQGHAREIVLMMNARSIFLMPICVESGRVTDADAVVNEHVARGDIQLKVPVPRKDRGISVEEILDCFDWSAPTAHTPAPQIRWERTQVAVRSTNFSAAA